MTVTVTAPASVRGLSDAFVIEEARTALALGLPVNVEAILTALEKSAKESEDLRERVDIEEGEVESLLKALDRLAVAVEDAAVTVNLPDRLRKELKKAQDCHDKAFDAWSNRG